MNTTPESWEEKWDKSPALGKAFRVIALVEAKKGWDYCVRHSGYLNVCCDCDKNRVANQTYDDILLALKEN